MLWLPFLKTRKGLFQTMIALQSELISAIRCIPDYPKPGIVFRDITTLLGNPKTFRRAIDELVHP